MYVLCPRAQSLSGASCSCPSHGPNELEGDEPDPLWARFLEQFKDPLIALLFASAFVSTLMGQYDDAISIALAVVIVATVAFVQEYRSDQVRRHQHVRLRLTFTGGVMTTCRFFAAIQALQELNKLVPHHCRK